MPESYNQVKQTRTTISSADTWTAVQIPIGARYPLLSIEDEGQSFRVSTDNSITTDQGIFVPAAGSYQQEGIATDILTIYISVPTSATVAILIYTQD